MSASSQSSTLRHSDKCVDQWDHSAVGQHPVTAFRPVVSGVHLSLTSGRHPCTVYASSDVK